MLEQTVKNRSQNGQIGVAIHEFHNLISIIIAEAQLLQLDFTEDDPSYVSAAAIERAGRRLETLADRLTEARNAAPEQIEKETIPHYNGSYREAESKRNGTDSGC